MHDFQPLSIAEVRRETADAISVTFEVPAALRGGIPLQARAST